MFSLLRTVGALSIGCAVGATVSSLARADDAARTDDAARADDVPPAEAVVVSVYRPKLDGSAFHERDPLPPGYHVETVKRKELLVPGAIVFGAAYAIPALGGLASADSRSLLIPVFGPLLYGTRRHTSTGAADDVSAAIFAPWVVFAVVLDSIAQGAGVALLVAGAASEKKILARDAASAVHVTPMHLGQAGNGVGLAGSF